MRHLSIWPPLSALPAQGNLRIAIIGIGNDFRGDDAAGVIVVRELIKRQANLGSGDQNPSRAPLLLLDAGPVPENFTGKLRQFMPDVVILVDAALLDDEPGAVRVQALESIAGAEIFTHAGSIRLFNTYLVAELRCKTFILGIQPAQDEFGAPLSGQVQIAVDKIVTQLTCLYLDG